MTEGCGRVCQISLGLFKNPKYCLLIRISSGEGRSPFTETVSLLFLFSFSHMIFTFCCCRDQEKIENWCNIQVWWQNSVTRLTWEIKFKFGGKLSFWESFEKIKRRSWKVGKLNLQQFLASTHTCVHIQCITQCVQTTYYNGSQLVVHLGLIAQLDDLCTVLCVSTVLKYSAAMY